MMSVVLSPDARPSILVKLVPYDKGYASRFLNISIRALTASSTCSAGSWLIVSPVRLSMNRTTWAPVASCRSNDTMTLPPMTGWGGVGAFPACTGETRRIAHAAARASDPARADPGAEVGAIPIGVLKKRRCGSTRVSADPHRHFRKLLSY